MHVKDIAQGPADNGTVTSATPDSMLIISSASVGMPWR